MYSYPQYIYPPTTVPVQRFFANPHVRTNEYDLGGIIGNIGGKLGGVFGGQGGSLMSGLGKIGITGGILGGIGSAVGSLGNKAISGGLSSGAGSAISGIGSTVGGLVGKVNPVLGAAVSAASGIIGGLTNRAFGSKLNDEAIAAIKGDVNELNTTRVTDTSNESIANQAMAQNWGGAFDKSTVGKDGWFANKAQKEYERLQRGMMSGQNYMAANYANASDNVMKNTMNNLLMNTAAYGGFFENPFSHPGSSAIAYGLEQQNLQNQQQMIGQMQQQNQMQQKPFSMPYACGGKLHCFGGRLFSYGGATNPHGSDFTNGLIYVENGGTHEENPYQGVPMGYDQQGVPNVVEEGEIVVPKKLLGGGSDYVLSNRIRITPEFANKYKLGGDLTVAEAAKKLTAESRENPNDIILEQTNAKLMQEMVRMQEQIKAEQQQQQMLEQAAAQQAMMQMAPEQAIAEQEMMQEGADLEAAEQEAMQMQPGMAFGGRMYSSGGFFPNVNILAYGNEFNDGVTPQQAWEAIMLPQFMRQLSSEMGAEGADISAIIDRYNKLQDLYKQSGMLNYNGSVIRNDNIKPLQQYFSDLGMNKAFTNELINDYYNAATHGGRTADRFNNFSPDGVGGGYTALRTLGAGALSTDSVEAMNNALNRYGVEYVQDDDGLWRLRQLAANSGIASEEPMNPDVEAALRDAKEAVGASDTGSAGSSDADMWQPLDTRWRMAPIWASGIATLMDQLGITNTPDYYGAKSLEALANRGRSFMPVSWRPIGERMSYNPFDPYQRMIAQNALAAANQRAIQDNSNGNAAMANAALVAQNRNNAMASGQLNLEGKQYNDNLYNTMLGFNSNIAGQNSQGMLHADSQNAHNWRLGQESYNSIIGQSLALRQQEKAASDAARALNLSNFVKGLSNYGKENMYFNMVMGNPTSGGYWFGKDGRWHYSNPSAQTTSTAQKPWLATNTYVANGGTDLTKVAGPAAQTQARFTLMPDNWLDWTKRKPFFNYGG